MRARSQGATYLLRTRPYLRMQVQVDYDLAGMATTVTSKLFRLLNVHNRLVPRWHLADPTPVRTSEISETPNICFQEANLEALDFMQPSVHFSRACHSSG